MRGGRLADCPSAELIVDWAKWATEPLRFACESGPCGFQLAREIRAMGVDCDIIAVTSIPRSTEDKRLKDGRRADEAYLRPGPGSMTERKRRLLIAEWVKWAARPLRYSKPRQFLRTVKAWDGMRTCR